MSRIFRKLKSSAPFWVCLFTSIIMLVAGFIIPPRAVINPSVLTAVGELFGFATLWAVVRSIDNGIEAKLTHGNTTLALGHDNTEEDKNE